MILTIKHITQTVAFSLLEHQSVSVSVGKLIS
jgi:hypothetical protein